MRNGVRIAGVLCVAGSLQATAVLADEAVEKSGQLRFAQYCAVCHGSGGKGDGPFANLLTSRPADLTQLARKNGGEFPFGRAYDTIDGRNMLTAHGTSDMPIWGKEMNEGGLGGETALRGKLVETLVYLRAIQEK